VAASTGPAAESHGSDARPRAVHDASANAAVVATHRTVAAADDTAYTAHAAYATVPNTCTCACPDWIV